MRALPPIHSGLQCPIPAESNQLVLAFNAMDRDDSEGDIRHLEDAKRSIDEILQDLEDQKRLRRFQR